MPVWFHNFTNNGNQLCLPSANFRFQETYLVTSNKRRLSQQLLLTVCVCTKHETECLSVLTESRHRVQSCAGGSAFHPAHFHVARFMVSQKHVARGVSRADVSTCAALGWLLSPSDRTTHRTVGFVSLFVLLSTVSLMTQH